MAELELAVIGGSGVYDMAALSDIEELDTDTPFGRPSDLITIGTLDGTRVAFLPRHGRGHVLAPSEVPYRANIYALKRLGVRYIISVTACGSLREDYEPGHIVVPDQLVDFTRGKRDYTFFGGGLVAHLGVAKPFSPELNLVLAEAVKGAGGKVHLGGSYITIEGPRFSTQAESNLYRQWGISIIGMTTSPEAVLAAEAEIAYSCLAHVTDYDVWHESQGPVTIEMVLRQAEHTREVVQRAVRYAVRRKASWEGFWPVHESLRDALSLVADWSKVPESLRRDLEPLIGRYVSA
jgi:5'-methylthioadenosine phosphorylase